MVTKIALILLFLAMPIRAQQSAVLEEGFFDAISVDAVDSIAAAPRDTTRYYVFDVKERTKCDTFTVPAPCPTPYSFGRCLALHQKTVIECNDTTWAPKIQVWLTPEQLRILMGLVGEQKQWELDKDVGRWSPIRE